MAGRPPAQARHKHFPDKRALLLANARVVTYPAGHAPHLETPDAFEAELERFLTTLPADGVAEDRSKRARASRVSARSGGVN